MNEETEFDRGYRLRQRDAKEVYEGKTQKMKSGIFETMDVDDVLPSTSWTFVSIGRYKDN